MKNSSRPKFRKKAKPDPASLKERRRFVRIFRPFRPKNAQASAKPGIRGDKRAQRAWMLSETFMRANAPSLETGQSATACASSAPRTRRFGAQTLRLPSVQESRFPNLFSGSPPGAAGSHFILADFGKKASAFEKTAPQKRTSLEPSARHAAKTGDPPAHALVAAVRTGSTRCR